MTTAGRVKNNNIVYGESMYGVSMNNSGFGRVGMIIILLLIITGLALFFMPHGGKKETIKIGAVLPLSGAGQFLGIEARDGMLLAADEINSRNGINGREIEFIIEDSKTDPQEGKRAFNKIEKMYRPLFYVSAMSLVGLAVAPLSMENRVVLVGLMTTTPRFTEKAEWVFRYFCTQKSIAQPILSILQELRIKKLGFIYINDRPSVSIFEIVKGGVQASGGIIRGESFEKGEVDYREQIKRLKNMEAICFIGFVQHIQNAFKQLREMNFKGSIITGSGGSDPTVVSMPEANGVYVSAPFIYNPNHLFAREAKEKYETKYDKPFNMFAAVGYDLLTCIAGLLKDKEISRDNLKNTLEEGFIYPGVFGVIDVKPGEHDIFFPLHPAQIQEGELKYLPTG